MTDELVRILLIEDNTADIYLFRKALANAGLVFELTVIEDGGRAMAFARGDGEYAASPVPDIAIIDLNLPKHDGIQIWKRPLAERLPICRWWSPVHRSAFGRLKRSTCSWPATTRNHRPRSSCSRPA